MAVVAEEKRVAMKTEVVVMSSGDNVVSSSSDDLVMQSTGDDTYSHADHHHAAPGSVHSSRHVVFLHFTSFGTENIKQMTALNTSRTNILIKCYKNDFLNLY